VISPSMIRSYSKPDCESTEIYVRTPICDPLSGILVPLGLISRPLIHRERPQLQTGRTDGVEAITTEGRETIKAVQNSVHWASPWE
jgi:hypothetical protein